MLSTLTTVHVIVSILLIIFVLIQFGKGAEAGMFSQDSGAVYSTANQGNILSKITTLLAIIFLGLAVGLSAMRSTTAEKSIFDDQVDGGAVPLSRDIEEGTTAPKNEATPKDAPANNSENNSNNNSEKK